MKLNVSFSEKLKSGKRTSKKKSYKENNADTLDNYLNIWQTNPSFKDINTSLSTIRAIFLIFLTLFFIISLFIIGFNLVSSVGAGIFILFLFIIIFHENFFSLKNFFSHLFHKFTKFNPFENLIFFFNKENPEILLFTNKTDLKTCAMSIFQVQVIPENVHPTINQFIKALNETNVPYSYQVVQSPVFELTNKNIKNKANYRQLNSIGSFKTNIYFGVFYDVNGILNHNKYKKLYDKICEYRDTMKSIFSSNFYHFNIKLLSGNELLRALISIDIQYVSYEEDDATYSYITRNIASDFIMKFLLCLFILSYVFYILTQMALSLSLVLLFNVIIVLIIFLLWWRSIFSGYNKLTIIKEENLTIINPFQNLEFYQLKEHSDSIFIHINKKLLMNIKIFNLKYAFPHFHNKIPFAYPDKFYRALINQKIPFTYSLVAGPISYYTFDKEGYKYLNKRGRNSVSPYFIKSDKDSENWLYMRGGIWKTMLTLSTFSYTFTESLKINNIVSLEDELLRKSNSLRNNFKMNYHSFELFPLKNQKLISGFLLETVKNKSFRLEGTHLNYLFFQGKALNLLTDISPSFKKGVKTRIAAEFNTPLHLENFITFGNTINTEFMENEVPVGFLLEQLQSLLIVNGTSDNREELTMKLVSELVKAKVPSLVFDFNGRWSKLINYFEGSRFEDEFLYFKLGSAFTLDPIHSEIAYDKNNIGFLNYMFDAYALAFKKPENTIEIFKNTILRNPDIDFEVMNLELKSQQSWQKNPLTDTMITLFDEFTNQEFVFFHTSQIDGQENQDKITFKDFIKDDRTVIIDLSISNDYKKQIFLMFIILSKMIHYICNSDDFIPKIIISPRLDLFFDSWYLDKTSNYGIIDKFLRPLNREGFGMIVSANQIKYLHQNVFNYFHNLITFKASDKKDIAILSSLMSLQELKDTGFYSVSRNTSYQIAYLMSMKNNEVLVKRSDINQVFPAIMNGEAIKESIEMDHEEIIEYMKRQGYDLKSTEKKLLEQAKKTIFEKDFGSYFVFFEEIIKFIKGIKTLDKVGNLYKAKIKEELKQCIYKKAIKLTKNKKKLEELRNQIFEILIKHGYLIESHPKTAGGSEALRTSYAVGPHYDKALNDYFNTKNNVVIDIINDGYGSKKDITSLFSPNKGIEANKSDEFKSILAKEMSELYFDMFQIYKNLNKSEVELAVKIEKDFVKKFLINLYKEIYHVNYIITDNDLERFILYLCNNKMLPFTKHELKSYLKRTTDLDLSNPDDLSQATEIYTLLSREFFDNIQKYLTEHNLNDIPINNNRIEAESEEEMKSK